jgi:hypothetical protein
MTTGGPSRPSQPRPVRSALARKILRGWERKSPRGRVPTGFVRALSVAASSRRRASTRSTARRPSGIWSERRTLSRGRGVRSGRTTRSGAAGTTRGRGRCSRRSTLAGAASGVCRARTCRPTRRGSVRGPTSGPSITRPTRRRHEGAAPRVPRLRALAHGAVTPVRGSAVRRAVRRRSRSFPSLRRRDGLFARRQLLEAPRPLRVVAGVPLAPRSDAEEVLGQTLIGLAQREPPGGFGARKLGACHFGLAPSELGIRDPRHGT